MFEDLRALETYPRCSQYLGHRSRRQTGRVYVLYRPVIITPMHPCHVCVIPFILIHHPLHLQNGHVIEHFEERFAAATPVRMRGPFWGTVSCHCHPIIHAIHAHESCLVVTEQKPANGLR